MDNRCIYLPCEQVVTDNSPHITLTDGAKMHIECMQAWKNSDTRYGEPQLRAKKDDNNSK